MLSYPTQGMPGLQQVASGARGAESVLPAEIGWP